MVRFSEGFPRFLVFYFLYCQKNKFQFYETVTKYYDVIFLVTKLKKKCKKL